MNFDGLRTWLEHWLGVEPAASGEGTAWEIRATHPWTAGALVAFTILLVLYVAWVYSREGYGRAIWKGLLGALRVAAVMLVVFMLFDVQLFVERTGLPNVAVLLDVSRSMDEADPLDDSAAQAKIVAETKAQGFDRPSRFHQAQTVLLRDNAKFLEQLAEDFKVELFFVADGVERAAVGATGPAGAADVSGLPPIIKEREALGDQSRLGRGVREALAQLRGAPPTAIVFLTDGITTDGETLSQVADFASRKNSPLYLVGLGTKSPRRDVAAGDVLVDEVVFVNDVVNFEMPVVASGFAGKPAKVKLTRVGSEETLAETETTLGPDGQAVMVRLPYEPTEVGEFEFAITVETLPGEADVENNRQTRRVVVRKDRIRVLLVEGRPRYEFRYLKALLQREPTIDLKVLLQDADVQWGATEPDGLVLKVFPVSPKELADYEVVVFGDVNPAFLGSKSIENLANFVKNDGGGVVFVSGPQFTPLSYRNGKLAELFPVDLNEAAPPLLDQIPKGFRPRLTDVGQSMPFMQLGETLPETLQLWSHFPEMYWLLRTGPAKPAARVLAEHPTETTRDGQPQPVIASQYAGKGIVLFHATDDLWRWRYRVGDLYFARYWVQAIRYLSRRKAAGSKRIELTTDRKTYRRGDPVRIRVEFLDPQLAPGDGDVSVVVERQDFRTSTTLARSSSSRATFEGVFQPPAEGRYHISTAVPTSLDAPRDGEPAPDAPPTDAPGPDGPAPATDATAATAAEKPNDAAAGASSGIVSADVTIEPPASEREQTQLDLAELTRAARVSGGKLYTYATASAIPGELPTGRRIPVESRPPRPLWNQWPVLLVFLLLLTTEWIGRKRLGMV